MARPIKKTAQPIAEIARSIKKMAQPIAEIARSIKKTAQPIAEIARSIKKMARPISEIARSIKKTAQPIAEIARPIKKKNPEFTSQFLVLRLEPENSLWMLPLPPPTGSQSFHNYLQVRAWAQVISGLSFILNRYRLCASNGNDLADH